MSKALDKLRNILNAISLLSRAGEILSFKRAKARSVEYCLRKPNWSSDSIFTQIINNTIVDKFFQNLDKERGTEIGL